MARFDWHDSEFAEMRKSPGMVAYLDAKGTEWVGELNTELHAAQEKRHQAVEDGYEHHVRTGGSRARLYIVAATARAQAHEAAHSAILKLMKATRHDVKRGEGEFKNPTKGWRTHGSDAQDNPIHGLD